MTNNDLYCKIFVDAEIEESQLVEIIRNLMGGSSWRLRTIYLPCCEIDVCKNDIYDPAKRLDPNEGFLYYRYFLDVVPVGNVSRQDYTALVGQFIVRLREAGFKAVPACDFEEELPKPE
jgi:hypothetical protein